MKPYKRPITGDEIEYTLEEFEWQGCLLDLSLHVDFSLEPYDPGVHTFRNGDPGYPPSGGGIDSLDATIQSVKMTNDVDGNAQPKWQPTPEELVDITKQFQTELDGPGHLKDRIEEACFEHAGNQSDADGWDDCDDRCDERREDRWDDVRWDED